MLCEVTYESDGDPFDPNTWRPSRHEFRIYGDDKLNTYAVVDEIDYHWAVRWRWSVKTAGYGKLYLRRATSMWEEGVRVQVVTTYLHVAIMKRITVDTLTPFHNIVDHRDGNSLNCVRRNLRWATRAMNSRNVHGSAGHDLIEG